MAESAHAHTPEHPGRAPPGARPSARAWQALRRVATPPLQAIAEDWLPLTCIACGVLHPRRAWLGRDAGRPWSGPWCGDCASSLPGRQSQRCPCCALAVADAPCLRCRSHPPPFAATRALCDYAAPVDAMIVAMKSGRIDIAHGFAPLLADLASQLEVDMVIPVPLAPPTLARRGYNQSVELARPVANALRLPLAPALLERARDTRSQKALDRRARAGNLRNAFAAAGPRAAARIAGRHVLVVDDVMTTGATLTEVAATLRGAGAASVCNLVVARTA